MAETTGDRVIDTDSIEQKKTGEKIIQGMIDDVLAKMEKDSDSVGKSRLHSAELLRLMKLKKNLIRTGAGGSVDRQAGAPSPKSAAQENLELLGTKMQAAGMNNDTNTPQHEHEYYEGNASNTPPPPPDGTTPPPPDVPPPPAPPEVVPPPPSPEQNSVEAARALLENRAAILDNAIKLFAKAKTRNESILSGLRRKPTDGRGRKMTDEMMFAEAKAALDASFMDYASTMAAYEMQLNRGGVATELRIRNELDSLARGDIPMTAEEAAEVPRTIATLQGQLAEIQRINVEYAAQVNLRLNAEMMKIRGYVDEAQLEYKYGAHPWMQKIGDAWKKNPGKRAVLGGAMLVTGAASAAVGFLPGVALATAGKLYLRGVGGYMAGEGAGGFFANRRAKKTTEAATQAQAAGTFNLQRGVGDLTTSMGREAKTIKRGRRAGAGLGLASAVGGQLLQHTAAPKPGVSHAEIGSSPSQPTPEQLDAWERYFGMTSTSPDAAANFDAMSKATPAVREAMRAGGVSLDQLTDPNWLKSNGVTSDAARRAFNFRLGQASVSPDATARFMGDLPNYLNQLRGMK